MASTTTSVPTEAYALDPVHSTVGFEVKHFGVSTFRTGFKGLEGGLQDGVLRGEVPVEGIQVDDPNFRGHLLSEEFFDQASTPTITFVSRSIAVDGGRAVVEGDLTIKGRTKAVVAEGEAVGPGPDPFGGVRLGLDLAATVNRHDFGLDWNADLPGGGKAVPADVKLVAHLELVQQQDA